MKNKKEKKSGPTQEEIKSQYDRTKETMRYLAGGIDEALTHIYNRKLGFTLLVFEFGKPGISDYISNANREDMIKGLRETALRLENKEDVGNREK